MTDDLAYILYAVAKGPKPDLTTATGVGGGPLTCLESKKLILVFETGSRPVIEAQFAAENLSDMAILERMVMAHQVIQTELWQIRPAIPFRFGTVVPSLDPFIDALISHDVEATETLDDLASKSEIGLQVILQPSTDDGESEKPDAGGRDYLRAIRAGRKSAADRQASQEEFITSLMSYASSLSNAETELSSGRLADDGGKLVLNMSYLLDTAASLSFIDEVMAWQESANSMGLRVRTVGPLPPQSFAVLDFLSDLDHDTAA